MKKLNFLTATVLSALGGAILGILFAPDEGSKTRKKIKKEGEDYLEALQLEIDRKREELNKHARDAKERAQKHGSDIRNEVERRRDDIMKRAKKVASYEEWTKEELYQRAKELEIENYSTMNKSELIDALRNR